MDNRQMAGWASVVLGVLVALSTWLGWSSSLMYLWAVLVLLLGVWELMGK